jgi:putative transposase
VVLRLTAGQAGDNPQLVPLLNDWSQQGSLGRRRRVRLLADKAYSHTSTRHELRRRRIPHTIPERSDQREYRASRGSKGGRPPTFDPACYAQRNTIERGFGRLKTVARYRLPLRQVRLGLPRRDPPSRHPAIPPMRFRRHALGSQLMPAQGRLFLDLRPRHGDRYVPIRRAVGSSQQHGLPQVHRPGAWRRRAAPPRCARCKDPWCG